MKLRESKRVGRGEKELCCTNQGCAKLGEVLETKLETKLWKISKSKLEIRNPKNLEISSAKTFANMPTK
jgi:hypothetical protein